MSALSSKPSRPRLRRSLIAVVAGGLVVALLSSAPAAAPVGAAEDGILFGAAPPSNGTNIQSLNRFEDQLGEDLDLVRVFMRWDESGRGRAYHQEILGGGRTMLISVRAKRMNGTKLSWSSIANAKPGSQVHNEIVKWADYLKTLDRDRVWFVFNHEPEIGENQSQGSPESYRAAFRKVHQVFDQRGAGDLRFGLIMSNYAYELQQNKPSDRRAAAKWYPGDDVVDLIGSDPYDWSNCRADNATVNRPMGQMLGYFRTFGAAHPGKGLVLGEWASTKNRNSGTQADFIDGTRELLKRSEWSQMVGISYFAPNDPAFPNCIWDPRGSSASMDALRTMARDPRFNGGGTQNAGGAVDNGGGQQVPAAPGKLWAVYEGQVSPGADSWEPMTFTAVESGRHTVTVSWSGGAQVRSATRVQANNTWVGQNLGERSPASYSMELQAGTRYRIAVWTRSGTADYRVEVRR